MFKKKKRLKQWIWVNFILKYCVQNKQTTCREQCINLDYCKIILGRGSEMAQQVKFLGTIPDT